MGNRKVGPTAESKGLHPRNRHRGRYDFRDLVKGCPELAPAVMVNSYGDLSIDYADPEAVRTLNKALLIRFYGVEHWEIPPEFLCPPVPGRVDYIHHLADLLGACRGGAIPRGGGIRVLDIGTGANCIYPLLGHREYGWSFVGTDINPRALAVAKRILEANAGLPAAIQLRGQASPEAIFNGVLHGEEGFELSMCNPPFHASQREAREGTLRKWRNLGRDAGSRNAPRLNFGGQGTELWCPGGEAAFLRRMIEESAGIPSRVLWFTALVSRSANLPGLRAVLKRVGVADSRTIDMAQGQKKSRILAWTFLDEGARRAWARKWR